MLFINHRTVRLSASGCCSLTTAQCEWNGFHSLTSVQCEWMSFVNNRVVCIFPFRSQISVLMFNCLVVLTPFGFRKRPGARQKTQDWNRSRKGSPSWHHVLIADMERSLDDATVADFPPTSTPPLLSQVQSPSLPKRPPQRNSPLLVPFAPWPWTTSRLPAARRHSGNRRAWIGLFWRICARSGAGCRLRWRRRVWRRRLRGRRRRLRGRRWRLRGRRRRRLRGRSTQEKAQIFFN